MDKFEEEIFDYLTEEDNFRPAYEIHQFFPEVKKKLITDFWNLVSKSLKIKTNDTNWEVEIYDNIFDRYSKMGLHLDNQYNKDLRVIFERLHGNVYYGLWINKKSTDLNVPKINDYANTIEGLKEIESPNNAYWLGSAYLDQDFQNLHTLESILPDKREILVDEYSNLLFEFAEDFEEEIREMAEMKIN